MTIVKIENGLKVNGEDFFFTNEILESGHTVHNDTQISVELNGMIKLFEVDSTEEFENQYLK